MKNIFGAMLLIAVMAVASFAQSNTGNLVGTVSDTSGVIPGATVVVKDNQSGRERTFTTNNDGAFTLPQLDVGTYTVTVKSSGHKTQTFSNVKIDIGKTYTLEAKVEVGDISEVVTVAAGADIINSNNGEISTTVTGRQIVELPLNGRNPLSLVLLQAGSSSNSAQNTTINGQRSSFTNITRDGINVQDNFIRANAVDFLPDRPNVDDTGEFTIVTQNAGAELGYGSSQVQLVTPRGSSSFHGAGYIYNRNSVVAANNFFNNFSGVKRPFLNRNQYGFKVGGPFWTPHFGEGGPFFDKNKAFFFFGWEGFRQRQSVTQNKIILLPDARTGIFTWRDTTGVTRSANIFTLASGLSGGPPTGIDSLISSRLLANIPTTGNNATLGDQLNTTGLTIPVTSNIDREAFSMRFDYDANERNSISAVYTYKKEINQRTDLSAQQGGAACCYTTTPPGLQDAHTPFLALSWRSTPTNALTNEVRGGWQKSDPIFRNLLPDPSFFIRIPLVTNPETGFQAQGRLTNIYNLQDNAVWILGNHSVRFGGQFDAFRADPFGPGAFGASFIPTYVLGGGATPTFSVTSFNNAAGCVSATGVNCINTAQLGAANGLLAFLGGLIGTANQTFNADSQTSSTLAPGPPARKLNYEHYGFYGSDQWRVSPSLTLNLGVRYELYTPLREPNGLALEPVLGGRDVRTAMLDPNGTYNFVGTNNGGHNFFKTDKNNFAPVVSFAWSPTFKNKFLDSIFPGNGKSVVRGGYRLSYVNDEFVRAADNALSGNAGLSQGLTIPTGLTSPNLNSRFNNIPTFTAPSLAVPRTYALNDLLAGNFGTVFAIDPNLKIPGSHEFSIGYQREIGFQTAIEVRFVHSRSNNLVRGLDLNQVKILDNGFLADFNRARNNIALYGAAKANCTVTATTPDCQPLQLLNTTVFGNAVPLTNTTSNLSAALRNDINLGNTADAAIDYLTLFGLGNNILLPNPNTGVADLLTNAAKSRYNALQVEIRRRFANGLTFQANYTYEKLLTDAPGTGQTRFDPLIDNANSRQEFAIGDTDTTHVFNLNAIYELPFGKGKPFFNDANGLLDRLIGGWQLTSIIRLSSGAPFTITDPRGTLNRAGRSGRQTAFTTLTKKEVKALLGVFRLPCGVFFIDPKVINLDLAQCNNGLIKPRSGGVAGVAALGFGSQPFDGQVFFNVAPGQTGNMEPNFLSGPLFFNWDASIIKNIPITERIRFQLRGEAFNVTNKAEFGITNQFTQANINSSTFGRLLSAPNPRVIQFVGRIEF